LIVILENFEFVAMMTYTFENLFNVLHKSIVEDWLTEFDVTEMSLTLSSLSASFTLLVHGTDTESKIIRTSSDRSVALIES